MPIQLTRVEEPTPLCNHVKFFADFESAFIQPKPVVLNVADSEDGITFAQGNAFCSCNRTPS
jgi:hypothetical protein